MDDIASQVRDLFGKADEQGRKKLEGELRDLQSSLDTEWDAVVRLGAAVSIDS